MTRRNPPKTAQWTPVYPGFSAYQKSNASIGYVRRDATGEMHATPGPGGPSADDVMMALYYAKKGDAAAAAERIRSYLIFCFGSAKVQLETDRAAA